MGHRKKVKEESTDLVSVQYQNKVAQVISLVGARRTFVHLGRGSAKTTDVQCERLIDLITDMPGAPVVWLHGSHKNAPPCGGLFGLAGFG